MPDNRKSVITVRMNQDDCAELKRYAAGREMSVSAVVRYLVKKELATSHEKQSIDVCDKSYR